MNLICDFHDFNSCFYFFFFIYFHIKRYNKISRFKTCSKKNMINLKKETDIVFV